MYSQLSCRIQKNVLMVSDIRFVLQMILLLSNIAFPDSIQSAST